METTYHPLTETAELAAAPPPRDFPTARGPLGWAALVAWAMTATRGERRRAIRL